MTGTGHAGLRIDTTAGSILCDPWVHPAYFASWFPFPDNSQLDWETLGRVDYLYVSHLHRDHFDPEHLRRFVPKDATVLLPDFPTNELEDELRALGFSHFVRTRSHEPVELGDGLVIMIEALTSPTDGPIGDSSLWLEHDGIRLFNQNDARPADLSAVRDLGPVAAHLLQFSGAIWYPMVYELPEPEKRALGMKKRARQIDRTVRYVDELGARWVFPIAGPPCFLDEELWELNDLDRDEANIFMDQQAFLDAYRELGYSNGVVLLPGSVAELTRDDLRVTHPVQDLPQFFADKEEYLIRYRERQRPAIDAEKASWRHPEMDVFAELKERLERLLDQSTHLAMRVGAPVRLGLVGDDDESVEAVVIDFPAKEVRRDAGEQVCYHFTMGRALVEHLLHIGEADWVNSLLLSCRFTAMRIGGYNESLLTFFKCLSDERLQYADEWCAAQEPETEDIRLGDWLVQRRCPHMKADLARFAIVDGDVLTCQLHGWQFDLETGRCLTSTGLEIRAGRRAQGSRAASP